MKLKLLLGSPNLLYDWQVQSDPTVWSWVWGCQAAVSGLVETGVPCQGFLCSNTDSWTRHFLWVMSNRLLWLLLILCCLLLQFWDNILSCLASTWTQHPQSFRVPNLAGPILLFQRISPSSLLMLQMSTKHQMLEYTQLVFKISQTGLVIFHYVVCLSVYIK